MKSPAFQFYPSDYLGSQRVQLMTLEEEGAYVRLLCSCWQHGSIPSEPELIARLIGKGASTTLATTVSTMFEPAPDPSRLIHGRLEEEREKQESWREKSSAGGKKSAEMRSKSKAGSTTAEPPLQPKANSPSPSPSSKVKAAFKKPTEQECCDFCVSLGLKASDGSAFFFGKEGNGWKNGSSQIKDWKATIKNWKVRLFHPSQANQPKFEKPSGGWV